MVSWREFMQSLSRLVSGCVNAHGPMFRFELGAR